MREIGGYLELDNYRDRAFHKDVIALNCGRNCIEYAILVKKIKKIKLPYFMCSSVKEKCEKIGVEISFYHIDRYFLPIDRLEIDDDEWIYMVNYYGLVSSEKISLYAQEYDYRLIVDYTHSFFEKPIDGVITIYSCRKYFGVTDGAYMYIDQELDYDIPIDISYDRMNFLLGRYELSAEQFYMEYLKNDALFNNEPLKRMSKLTANLLNGIDYEFVKNRRTDNFSFLNSKLAKLNLLDFDNIEGAFAYPLLLENGERIRSELIKKKIFIPTLWLDALSLLNKSDLEYYYVKNILPIPCDQRYNIYDMKYVVEEIYKCIN